MHQEKKSYFNKKKHGRTLNTSMMLNLLNSLNKFYLKDLKALLMLFRSVLCAP